MMKSRISIEMDFDNGSPFIRVIESPDSDDVKDRIVSQFRNKLNVTSFWCRVEFPFTNEIRFWHIYPITPDKLETTAKEMMALSPGPKMVNVYGNSDAFREFLKSKGIDHSHNGQYTLVDANADLFEIGREYEKHFQSHTK